MFAADLSAGLDNLTFPFQTMHFDSSRVPLSICIKKRGLNDSSC